MQIRLFCRYHVVRGRSTKGALRCCASLMGLSVMFTWSNVLSTNKNHSFCPKQAAYLPNLNSNVSLKMKRMNVPAARGLYVKVAAAAIPTAITHVCNTNISRGTNTGNVPLVQNQPPSWFQRLWLYWMESVMKFTTCLHHVLNQTCTPEDLSPVTNHPHPMNPKLLCGWL